ncbi:hypothetical protein LWI28_009943 [Acer negundo]|uniref:Reverse transcriptase zinc-binding domain-containing protein n=1 Tax=Acer negundo TaxID=4023 RepID=A0AAD5IDY2_ACENE|nr:hypothetical protein LWI28_009943 [Acer negundo]
MAGTSSAILGSLARFLSNLLRLFQWGMFQCQTLLILPAGDGMWRSLEDFCSLLMLKSFSLFLSAGMGGDDFLLWHFDKTCMYYVQSGYRIATENALFASVSNQAMSSKWWELLWSLNVPPKVCIFIWRACWNALPFLENLWKRKSVDNPVCPLCEAQRETTSHALF